MPVIARPRGRTRRASIEMEWSTCRSVAMSRFCLRDGLLAKKPAAAVKRPGVEFTQARHLNADAIAQVLTNAQGSTHYQALVLIAATGLGRGEAQGLSWSRVDPRRRLAEGRRHTRPEAHHGIVGDQCGR
jgi:integrase